MFSNDKKAQDRSLKEVRIDLREEHLLHRKYRADKIGSGASRKNNKFTALNFRHKNLQRFHS
jgi:hypothetical protein